MTIRSKTRNNLRHKKYTGILGISILSISILLSAYIIHDKSQISPVIQQIEAPVIGAYDIVTLPVPSKMIPVGTRVKDISFKQVDFPKHQVPKGVLTELDAIIEGITIVPLPANLPLFAENFSKESFGINPVTERIPEGMRAMTVRVDETTAVEGWAGSGSVVDVLLVAKNKTTVVAEKVTILSAERRVAPVEGDVVPNIPKTITLLVSQEQCLAINTAIHAGKLAFALRSANDNLNWGNRSLQVSSFDDAVRGNAVSGVVRMKANDGSAKLYALVNNNWIEADSLPEGFLLGRQ